MVKFKGFAACLLALLFVQVSCKSHRGIVENPKVMAPVSQINLDSVKETIVVVNTMFGNMYIKLYDETPLHKANFIALVNKGYYDSLLFHRVIERFMIQGGDPDSKYAKPNAQLGNGEIGKWIPAEFNQKLFHKKGVLAAARESDDINPKKESSSCQFYLVQGKMWNDVDLLKKEMRCNQKLVDSLKLMVQRSPEGKVYWTKMNNYKILNLNDSSAFYEKKYDALVLNEYNKAPHYSFSNEQKQAYKTVGGTPHLDNNYTVFGEVIQGIEIIDKIAAMSTNSEDRPLTDVRMKMWIYKKN